MPFLHFAGHSVKTRGVFPQGHRKGQSAVPYVPLTYLARGRTPPLPSHLGQRALIRLNPDISVLFLSLPTTPQTAVLLKI